MPDDRIARTRPTLSAGYQFGDAAVRELSPADASAALSRFVGRYVNPRQDSTGDWRHLDHPPMTFDPVCRAYRCVCGAVATLDRLRQFR
jgi:hypothetical protein